MAGKKYPRKEEEKPIPKLVVSGFEDAERYVLACIIINQLPAMERFSGRGLTQKAFTNPAYQLIYAAAQELFETGQVISRFSIMRKLTEAGEWERLGGNELFASLLVDTDDNNLADAEKYADALLNLEKRRDLYSALSNSIELVQRTDRPLGEVMDQIATEVEGHVQNSTSETLTQISAVATPVYEDILKRYADPDSFKMVSTGLSRLDHLLGGLMPGALYIIAARPGKGKTALGLSMAHHVAKVADRSVLIFSLEMGKEEITKRLVSIDGHIDSRMLREPQRLSPHIVDQLPGIFERIADLPIYVDENPNPPVTEIRATVRRVKRECPKDKPLEVVIIDYLQLMGADASKGGGESNRNQEISVITRTLKQLARTEKVALLLLSQLSRDVEKRQGASGASSRPKLSDLRDSGSIESDADVVMFVHRDEPSSEEAAAQIAAAEVLDAMVLVQKNRHGSPGDAHCSFMPKYMHFVDVVSDSNGPPPPPPPEEDGFAFT